MTTPFLYTVLVWPSLTDRWGVDVINQSCVFVSLACGSDQKQIYIGDDNPLTLAVTAENSGEGAYEAELHVIMPPQADFIGVVRNSEVSEAADGEPWQPFCISLTELSALCAVGVVVKWWMVLSNLVSYFDSHRHAFSDSLQAVLCVQEREPDQDGGVWPGKPHERRHKGQCDLWHLTLFQLYFFRIPFCLCKR